MVPRVVNGGSTLFHGSRQTLPDAYRVIVPVAGSIIFSTSSNPIVRAIAKPLTSTSGMASGISTQPAYKLTPFVSLARSRPRALSRPDDGVELQAQGFEGNRTVVLALSPSRRAVRALLAF